MNLDDIFEEIQQFDLIRIIDFGRMELLANERVLIIGKIQNKLSIIDYSDDFVPSKIHDSFGINPSYAYYKITMSANEIFNICHDYLKNLNTCLNMNFTINCDFINNRITIQKMSFQDVRIPETLKYYSNNFFMLNNNFDELNIYMNLQTPSKKHICICQYQY